MPSTYEKDKLSLGYYSVIKQETNAGINNAQNALYMLYQIWELYNTKMT